METKVKAKAKKANAPQVESLAQYAKRLNVQKRGTGTKFWITLLKEKRNETAVIHLSNDGKSVYFVITDENDESFHINLGMYYDTLQSLVEFEGQEIDVVIAPRVPNPVLTDKDIDAVESNPLRGKSAVAKIRAARLAEEPQAELVLVSYTEPEE
jgi:hypothetical protein